MHFCVMKAAGGSMHQSNNSVEVNIIGTLNLRLLNMMLKNNVSNFIFSSSSSVYGEPKSKYEWRSFKALISYLRFTKSKLKRY